MKTKFALVDNVRTEATKGAKGFCPVCGSELIAKCGEIKINHWAHKGERNCDPWWENETEWHRLWKNNFLPSWQEIILTDQETGEKHIADVRTAHGLTIEFQHSHLDPLERTKREKFYKNMIWIVDGTRLNRDYPRFCRAKENFRLTRIKGIYLVDYVDKCFPSTWVNSSVPVIFDFKGTETITDPKDLKNNLYCLYPKSDDGKSAVAIIPREFLIHNIKTGVLFKQTTDAQKQIATQPVNNNIPIRSTPQTHYYDPRTGNFKKRVRF